MRNADRARVGLALLLCFGATGAGAASAGLPGAWEAIDTILGRPGKVSPGEVHKYGWPRTDLRVSIAGVLLEPTLALGSWAGFAPAGAEGRWMAMGDLVLLPQEVARVVRALQQGRLDVLAIHNHLIGESPQVLYLHFGGHGSAAELARTVRSALDETGTPLSPPGAAPVPSAAEAEAFEKVQSVLGRRGSLAGRVLQVSIPRSGKIVEGDMEVPPSIGMATALNFQAAEGRIAATGDFVLVADEVNPVIRELESHGIHATALHSHMLRETPRLFFLHFWGLDDPTPIGEGLKAALARVAAP